MPAIENLSPEDLKVLRSIRCAAFDFDGVFTDNAVYVSETGAETVRCTRADGLGLDKLRLAGIEMVVISTEKNPVVGARCQKLKLPYLQGCDDKVAALRSFVEPKGITLAQTSFLGNDLNDGACLGAVGFPAVVADAHPDVLDLAKLQTKRPGGHGAVREFCDLLSEIHKTATS